MTCVDFKSKDLLIIKCRFKYQVNLSELINFYSPWNHQKAYSFLMVSWEVEGNDFAQIHLI